ncbi:hypothetical protein JOD03_002546 [Chryseomicrobium aureum]|nr:hypothetical protein [Chryseomicrobium aureum]
MTQPTPEHKFIRSLRVSNLLAKRGYQPDHIEPSRQSSGYLVFRYRNTVGFQTALNDVYESIGADKRE